MSHRRYGSVGHRSEKTIFNSLHENRGIETFKTALESSPDVLNFLKAANRQDSHEDFLFQKKSQRADMRGLVPRSKTGHNYGINTRFPSRPESSPGFSVNTSPPKHPHGLRFQSRAEKRRDSSSPGPQTYLVTVPSNPSLGVMLREPKFRVWQEAYSSLLGPGSYDAKPVQGKAGGWEFSKSSGVEDSTTERGSPVPGPGHYVQRSVDTSISFSIPKSEPPLFSESEKIGPGYYQVADPYKGASTSGRFSSVPRFQESKGSQLLNYQPRYKHLDPSEKAAQKARIEANKDTSASKPENRLLRIARGSQKRAFQRDVARLVKMNLQASVIERRKTALEDKFRKLEMRMRKDELRTLQKLWVAALTYVGSIVVFRYKFENRKALHQRSQSVLKFLMLVSVCLGVILRKRGFIRKRRALVVLRRLGPCVGRWRIQKRREFREDIANCFEKAMMQNVIYQLMRRWIRTLLMVQRSVRRFLNSRRVMYATLKQTWNLTEAEIHKNLAKSKALKTEFAYEGASSIPEAIKDYFLRRGLQKKFIAYFAEVKKYRAECERLRKIQQENSLDNAAEAIMLGIKPEQLYFEVPLPPVFSVFLTKPDVKALILEAETNRVNWDKILQKTKATKPPRSASATERSR